MDAKIINPFLEAAVNVLKTMAMVEVTPGKPFLKKDQTANGDASGIIGITGEAQGSMSISFSTPCICAIVSNLFGSPVTELNEEVKDAVGELTNMICGDARRRLEAAGIVLQAGTPTVISGQGHTIKHISKGPCVAMPFTTPNGDFTIELAFN
ncbi:MAG: chemotaxis protein CheX [Deltaproteobacteria bacterium]|nr:chemotaxis protein CheX [Deltaproteobacteria bacterium]